MILYSALLGFTTVRSVLALVLPDNVGKLPALGWNSWNAFACNISEENFLTAAQEIVDLGLKDAGYEYVNIDDCWSIMSGRDPTTQRIIPDPAKFPDGINGTADKIHALGLKIGIYSSAGTETCAGYPASLGLEEIDAATFAEWGIDYLKYDNCNVPSNWTDVCNACVPDSSDGSGFVNGTCPNTPGLCPVGYDYSTSNTAERYRRMRDALLAQNRTILYSLCDWGRANVTAWGNETGSSWRMSGDITANWSRIAEILNENSFELNAVNFWGHNDPDMLEIGNGNLTTAESRSHFAFWAAMKSPMLIGTSLPALSAENLAILKNSYLLAFNQDPVHGEPATPYKWGYNEDWTFDAAHPAEYWAGKSSNGTLVLMLNTADTAERKVADWGEIPGLGRNGRYQVVDVWSGESLGCVRTGLELSVESHDTAVLLVQSRC